MDDWRDRARVRAANQAIAKQTIGKSRLDC